MGSVYRPLQDGDVTTPKLAASAVTAGKLSGAQAGAAPVYGARAWVNFNGAGTVAIRAAGNVGSITDNGVGNYTLNFTTAMLDANYAVCGIGRLDGSADDRVPDIGIRRGVLPAVGSVQIQATEGSTTAFDPDFVTAVVFR